MSNSRKHKRVPNTVTFFSRLPVGARFMQYKRGGNRPELQNFVLTKVSAKDARDDEGVRWHIYPNDPLVRVRG